MATGPIDPLGGLAAASPRSWVPPNWDTSGGVPEQPLVAGPEFPPPPWAEPALPPPELGTPALASPDALAATAESDIELDQPALPPPPDSAVGRGVTPPAWALPQIGQAERETPVLSSPDDLASIAPEFTEQDALDDRVRQLAELDPEAFAQVQAQHALRLENEKATKLLAESERQKQLLEENVTRRAKAREAAQAELAEISGRAKALADGSPFEQWWSSRSSGQKFAGYVAAIFGGFLMPRTGGRNSAIDFFSKLAEDDANQKWMSLRERRAVAADQLGQADEDYRARESFRLASYEQVARGLEAELALLDPQGTSALRMAEALRGVRAQQAQAAAAIENENFNRADKMIKADQEQQKIDLERAKAEDAAMKWRLQFSRAGAKKQDPVFRPEYFKALGLDEPPMSMTEKEYKGWLENRSKVGEIKAKGTQQARDVATEARQQAGLEKDVGQLMIPGLETKSGKVVLGLDPDEAKDLRNRVADTRALSTNIDRMTRLLEQKGTPTDIAQSKEWRELQANKGQAIAAINGALLGGGVVREGDIEFANKALLAGDMTGFRQIVRDNLLGGGAEANAAGLRELRKTTIRRLNTHVREKVRPEFRDDIIDVDIPELTSQGAQGKVKDTSLRKELKEVEAIGPVPEQISAFAQQIQRHKGVAPKEVAATRLPPQVRERIDNWTALAKGGTVRAFGRAISVPAEDQQDATAMLQSLVIQGGPFGAYAKLAAEEAGVALPEE